MLRRWISVMLIPLVLLSQGAALGHCHGSDVDHDHAGRPHLHLELFAKHHASEEHHAAQDEAVAASAPAEHDDDAFYFPLGAGHARVRLTTADDLQLDLPAPVCWAFHLPAEVLNPSTEVWPRSLPPPRSFIPTCPVYLLTLTLRN